MTESIDQTPVATGVNGAGVDGAGGGAAGGAADTDVSGVDVSGTDAADMGDAGTGVADADVAGADAVAQASADVATGADTAVADTDAADTDASDADGVDTAAAVDDPHDELVAEGDAAGDYLERLLDILDYDGDIDLDVEGDRAVVSIVGDGDIDTLVGDHGQVLNALQELTRLAAGIETGVRSRLMLDIAGYRAKRRAELTELGRETAEQVVASGEPVTLGVMNPFERKVVHDAVAGVDGATSSSIGQEPRRRVVVSPAD